MCQTSPSTAPRENASLDRPGVDASAPRLLDEDRFSVCMLSEAEHAAVVRGLRIAANTLRACMPMGAAALTEADRLDRFATRAEQASRIKALFSGVTGEQNPRHVKCVDCARMVLRNEALRFEEHPLRGKAAGYFLCRDCESVRKNPNGGGPTQSEVSEHRTANAPLPAAVLGAQLPETLGLIGCAEAAEVSLGMIAALLDDQLRGWIGNSGDSTSPLRKTVEQLREISRSLKKASEGADRERAQVVQILDAIVDKAQPPKAAVAIRPSPRPIVKLGPGGDFSIDVKA